ncbi:MAG TPA: hypothetical protein VFM31_10715 [Nitrososphaeraceae archaeon]|nr:hypothetical protein [Nitrososphaeraceae archaeon]
MLSNSSLNHLSQRTIVIIIIGAVIMTLGFFGAIAVGSIAINDGVNYKLTLEVNIVIRLY